MRRVLAGVATLLFVNAVNVSTSTANESAKSERQQLYVQVQTTKIRSQPMAWSKPLADLRYGDALRLVNSETDTAGWIRVQLRELVGYVHSSAITPRKVVLNPKAGGSRLEVASADIVLAGKGFNREVEKELALERPTLNFRAVDRMEQIVVSENEIRSFIDAGRLAK